MVQRLPIIPNLSLSNSQKMGILFTGGEERYSKKSMLGDITLKMKRSITANKCLIAGSGLTEGMIQPIY